jgi:hypothetical protein
MDLKKQTVVELQFVDHHFGNLLGPDDRLGAELRYSNISYGMMLCMNNEKI